MKFRKIAAAAAGAAAVSIMAVNAHAVITNADESGNYVYDVIANGINVTDVYGISFTISDYDASQGIGGGIGANSPSTGWESHEWGNADAGKELILDGSTVTFKKDTPIFSETDASDPDNAYAQLWIQEWWGSDISVDNAVVLDKDGNALTASVPDDTAPADDSPASDSDTTSAETGNVPAAVMASVMAAAGAAAIASRKAG